MSCASCRSLPCESVQGSEGSEDTKRTRGEAYHGCLQTGTTQDVVFDLELERALWSASVVDAVRSPLPAHLLARAGFSATASVVHGGQGTPTAPARGQRSTAVASQNAIGAAPGVSKHRAGRPLNAPGHGACCGRRRRSGGSTRNAGEHVLVGRRISYTWRL